MEAEVALHASLFRNDGLFPAVGYLSLRGDIGGAVEVGIPKGGAKAHEDKEGGYLWPTKAKRAGKRRVVRDTMTKNRLEDTASASAE